MLRKLLPSVLVAALVLGALAFLSPGGGASQGEGAARRATTWAPGGTRERLTPDNCVVAFIDHQTGLMNVVDNARPTEFKGIVVGLAKTAKLHGLPTVITTSAESGANGPFLPEVLELLPDAQKVLRQGQINAWDDPAFVEAIERAGRRKIVMAGITTDVCVAFAALSALDAGYEVYVVTDASGSMNAAVQDASIVRMADAGAEIGTWFALTCELLSDWRNPAGPGTAQILVEHMPGYAEVLHSHQGAAQSAGKR